MTVLPQGRQNSAYRSGCHNFSFINSIVNSAVSANPAQLCVDSGGRPAAHPGCNSPCHRKAALEERLCALLPANRYGVTVNVPELVAVPPAASWRGKS
jgi:hypothetical protein